MFVYILILMVSLLKNIKIYRENQFVDDDFLSKTYTKRLKGVCAILIVLHHISQKGNYQLPFILFNRIGCLIVAIFFFLSGYGMSKSYNRDKKTFSSKFAFRIWHLMLPYLVVLVLTIIELKWNGNEMQVDSFLKGLRFGTIIGNWFFYSIIFLYSVFEIIFCRLSIKHKQAGLVLVICVTGYILWQANWNGWWYNSILAFAIGSIFAFNEYEIKAWFKAESNYWMAIGLLTLFYIGLRIINSCSSTVMIGFFLSESLAPTVFAVMVVLLNMKFRIMNSWWDYIGNISYEIFLLHVLFLRLFRGQHIYLNSNVLFTFWCWGALLYVQICLREVLTLL